MNELSVKVMYAASVDADTQDFVDHELNVDGILYVSSNDEIKYAGAGPSPENIFIDFVGFIVLAFAAGFANNAGADAWDKLKERLKAVRNRHRGGLEIEFLESVGDGLSVVSRPQH